MVKLHSWIGTSYIVGYIGIHHEGEASPSAQTPHVNFSLDCVVELILWLKAMFETGK